jgi:hypothetical protein
VYFSLEQHASFYLSDKLPLSGDENELSGEFILLVESTSIHLFQCIKQVQSFLIMKLKKNVATSEAGIIWNLRTRDNNFMKRKL